jgi:hypothetical protein
VKDAKSADAVLDAQGEYSNGAFFGSLKFTNASGRVLWSASATRPAAVITWRIRA